jgi:hypothetical protein
MTTEDSANSADAGSEPLQPSTDLNNPSNWDFEDEQTDNLSANETKPKAGTDPESETDESATDAQEADDPEQSEAEDAETAEAETSEVSIPDDALVTLPNGEKVKFSELKKSPMLDRDYRQKTMELGNQRRALGEQATRIQNVTEAFVNFLAEQIPDEPSIETAVSNPNEYIKQKALRDAAVARIQGLLELSNNAKAQAGELSETELQAARAEAAQVIGERLPFLRDPVKAREFDKSVAEAAAFIGIPQERVAKMHRPEDFLLAYYAQKGIKAEQAEKKVQAKVQAAPQATPVKTAKPKGNPDFLRNKEAMRRLQKSGSIKDAMAIDFD